MRICKLLLPLLATTLAFAAQPDRILNTIDSSQTFALPRSVHPRVQPQFDQGAVDPSFQLTYMTLVMAPSPSQQKALDELLLRQQDPKSSNYHKWLTPAQFADRFGLSQNDLDKVTAWLQSQGFQILSTGGGRNSVIFSGSAAQVASTFDTEIHHYKVDGEMHIANSTALMIPAALNGIVKSVAGIHDFRPQPVYQGRGVGGKQKMHSDYYDALFGAEFLAPGDIGTIYDLNPLYSASPAIDGTGQKLAVVGQTDIFLSDINFFRNGFGLTAIPTGAGGCTTDVNGLIISPCNTTNLQYVLLGTDPHGVSQNDIGEADLDVEWTGAVARNAQIIFVNGETADGVNDSLRAVVNSPGPPLAPVVSMSYGICEVFAEDLESVLQQANAEGVTVVNSSGDAGSATCDRNPPSPGTRPFKGAVGGLAVAYPASSPEVTAVGGTGVSIADDAAGQFWGGSNGATGGSALSYIPEIPWNDDVVLAQFCQSNPNNGFCTQAPNPPPGWVTLTSSATAKQVQQDIWISIGGGGASNCFTESNTGVCTAGFPQPSYQQALSVPSAPAGVRYVPDVSLFASPNFPGYIYCTSANASSDDSTCAGGIASAVENFLSIVGGTSASAPVFAGTLTLLNQYLVANAFQNTAGLGNANPNLYHIATYNPGTFHKVTSGSNTVYCQVGTPSAQPQALQCPAGGSIGYSASNADAATGYNLVTGLGSIDANSLTVAWGDSLTASTTSISPSASQIVLGQSETFAVTVTPSTASGVVSFFNNGSTTALGTAQVSSGSASFTTTALPGGTDSVKATYNGIFASSTSSASSVTVAVPTFTITPGVTTLSLAPGATSGNAVNLTLASTDGFIVSNGGNQTTVLPLTYTCTITASGGGAASEATCSVSPASPTSVINPTVSVLTTAPTAQLQPRPGPSSGIFYAMLLPGLFGIVFAAGSGKRSARLLGLIVVLSVVTLGLASCGGGSGGGGGGMTNPGTPPGSYTVNVNATTGGASPITASTSVALTVQ